MEIFIQIIGILITSAGIMIFLNPKTAKKMLVFWMHGKNIYLGGIIRVFLGVIFLYYTSQARLPLVMFTLGILALLGGLILFILGAEKIKAILERFGNRPDYFFRLVSLLVFVFGVLIIYSA